MLPTSHSCVGCFVWNDGTNGMISAYRESSASPAIRRRWRALRYVLPALALAALGVYTYVTVVDVKLLRPYRDSFARGDLSNWNMYGGQWTVNDGVLEN